MITLWQKLSAKERARDIASRKASIVAMERDIDGGGNRNAEFLPTYRAVVQLLEIEEARIAGVPIKQVTWLTPALRLAKCFFLAAFILTMLDTFQVFAGVESGGSSMWLTQLKFGLVGLVLGIISPKIDPRPHPHGVVGIAWDLVVFVVSYLATATAHVGAGFLAGAMGFLGLYVLVTSSVAASETLPFILLLGIVGPALEIFSVKLGWFSYTHPDFLGIPLWLPFLWANGAFITRDLFARRRS